MTYGEILIIIKKSINNIVGIPRLNQNGFTLIEILVVLVILGILASIAQSKLIDLEGTSANRALEAGVMELNAREKLTWADFKLSQNGWTNDNAVFTAINKNLGVGYNWIAGPDSSGGTLQFNSKTVVLTRTSSTEGSTGQWK